MLRRLARPLMGLAFVSSGVDGLRDDGRRAERARDLGVSDPRRTTRTLSGVQVGAGALLALGRFPRLSSLALALTVVPESATAHAFWAEQDKQGRQQQRAAFARDLGLLGGLLIAIGDGGGGRRKRRKRRRERSARGAR